MNLLVRAKVFRPFRSNIENVGARLPCLYVQFRSSSIFENELVLLVLGDNLKIDRTSGDHAEKTC